MKSFLLALFCCLLFLSHASAQDVAVPEIHRRITDLTGTLLESEQRQLESVLERFEQETSNQIAVLMIPSLGGESLEDFSLRVAEKNQFGRKGRSNGVLLFMAKEDRKLRIEVGYGLEGALPDAVSGQIIRHEIAPHFRQGDYAGGISAGITAIMEATKGEYQGDGGRSDRNKFNPVALIIALLAFMFFGRMIFGRRHYIGRRGYNSSWPWFGGFGGGGGGGFGGGGGGGGGFSGGGGSFGGGGASGSW